MHARLVKCDDAEEFSRMMIFYLLKNVSKMQLLERFLVSLVVVVVLVGLLVQANLEEDPAGSAVK